jgi:4-phytase/acid phosphatase
MKRRGRLFSILFVLAAAGCAPNAAAPGADGLHVERVVMLMRHGIRPPTKATVTPPGIAAEAWPTWSAPFGHLTQHGYDAVKLLGTFDRTFYTEAGLLSATGCAAAGEIVVHSDSDERTIRTGDAMIEGMFPNCGVVNDHHPEGEIDVLYSPLDAPGSMDANAAQAAILAQVGSLQHARDAHRAQFDELERVLGCCQAPACPRSATTCHLADMPSEFVTAADEGRPKLTGPMDFGPSAAMTLMLEYVEGMPMNQVGWGRMTREQLQTIMGLHSMKGEVLQRPYYVGARGASPLLRRMMAALQGEVGAGGSRLTVLVGHDTNISDMSGLLGFDWQVDSFPAHTPPPGGAFGLELLRDAQGHEFVRAFYRSQTMDQMRELTPLNLRTPAFRQIITIPGCAMPDGAPMCPLSTFVALAQSKLIAESAATAAP